MGGAKRYPSIFASHVIGFANGSTHPPGYGPHWKVAMNGNRYYGVRLEGAKYGVGFGSALAIAISYTNNHSILWAIIHGILGWLYVIYVALFG
jgi:hypothetical protein